MEQEIIGGLNMATHTHENADMQWQTITISKIEGYDKEDKDAPKYYIGDVNLERTNPPGTPLLFRHRVDLILLAFGILGFCVYPKQSWLEVKGKINDSVKKLIFKG